MALRQRQNWLSPKSKIRLWCNEQSRYTLLDQCVNRGMKFTYARDPLDVQRPS